MPKRGNARFFQLHESFLARGRAGPIGLLFLGDSVTERWAQAPEIWKEHYGKYQPANFGIGGDATQHVIWRIEHGELDGIRPAVVVLLLGTNNTAHNTAEQIAAADAKIVRLIREKIPGAKVLLLAIFPKVDDANGKFDWLPQSMAVVRAANSRLAKLDDGVNVRFLDIGARFLGPDGKIPATILVDQVHPTVEGYRIWAEAMQPLLDEMLGGWRSLPTQLANRIRANRANLPPAAQEDAWMARSAPEIVAVPNLAYLKPAAFDPRWTSLDVFRPRAAAGKAPIVVFVHGGGMSAGDKSPAALVENKARFFPAHGFVFVSVNYRLAPEATHPVPTQDLAAALAFVRQHAPAWGGDPDALILIGHSAGAQLVVQLVTEGSFLAASGVPASSIRGVISVDAMLYDLPFALKQSGDDWLVRDLVEMTYGSVAARLQEASPITHLTPAQPLPPMLLFHAVDPQSLSCLEAQRFAERLRATGHEVELQPAREKDHSHLGRDIGNSDDWITAVVMGFISKHAPAAVPGL